MGVLHCRHAAVHKATQICSYIGSSIELHTTKADHRKSDRYHGAIARKQRSQPCQCSQARGFCRAAHLPPARPT